MARGKKSPNIDKLTEEYLRKEHSEKGRSVNSIARGLGVASVTVLRRLAVFNIPALVKYPKVAVGAKYSRLLVIEQAKKDNRGREYWLCRCDCGKEVKVTGHNLKYRGVRSCGCLHVERAREANIGIRRSNKTSGEMPASYWNYLVRGAERRGISFSVTCEQAEKLYRDQGGACALSGLPIAFAAHWNTLGTASLDRKDSDFGYCLENVQWVHKDINRMKWAFTQEDFVAYCAAVTKHQKMLKRQAA